MKTFLRPWYHKPIAPVDLSAYLASNPPDDSLLPFVSVIVPCLNESAFIAATLDSLLKNVYPQERFEILVVDAMSTDGTREIVQRFYAAHPKIHLIDNPEKAISTAMNLGIEHAKGEIVMKMDAHSTAPDNYIDSCVWHMFEFGADNVGGRWNILPRKNTSVARAIVSVIHSRFGSGNAPTKVS